MAQSADIEDSDWELNIEFNHINLPLALVNSLRHHLNNAPLWGLPARTIKFSKYSFTRKLYGRCYFYYRHSMGFSIRPTWTQTIADQGRMRLLGEADGFDPYGIDPTDPDMYVCRRDALGNPSPVLRLDVDGEPIVSDAQIPGTIVRNPYPLGNLLLLGIPASLTS